MQGLDPATDIYSAMEPTTSKYINDVWYEINNVDEWKKMMTRVNQGLPPTDEDIVDEMSNTVLATTGSGQTHSSTNEDGTQKKAKRTGSVAVRNGNGITGAGTERPSASRNWAIRWSRAMPTASTTLRRW